MPNLATTLRAFEIDQLQQIALLWGLDFAGKEKNSLLLNLELYLPQSDHFAFIFNQLPEPSKQALMALKNNDGKLSWSTFAQRFGEIRALGKALRKKEQPWAFPASVSESLWYHGLLGRDFLRVEGDLQEMAYLPDEIIPLLPDGSEQPETLTLKPLLIDVNVETIFANSEILDESCILLAALRFENSQDYLAETTIAETKWALLETLLQATGVLDQERQPTDLARRFLELPRGQALSWLGNQWLKSTTFHEIQLLPELQIETDHSIHSQSARQTVVDLLKRLQAGHWYSLDDLIALIKSNNPDFLRQQEEYFSWTVKKVDNLQELISGYESWFSVEGALVTFILLQILPWLGLVDTGTLKEVPSRKLFRLRETFFTLDDQKTAIGMELEDAPINLASTGKIIMTNRSPRLVRYQILRFVEWLEVSPSSGIFQITPASLAKAKAKGLLPKHLIQLLRKHAEGGLPPIFYEALKRWESEGTQASIQTQTILRLGSPEILQALRESTAAHWLGESLSPTTVMIKPAGEKPILLALSSMGYLTDYNESESNNG